MHCIYTWFLDRITLALEIPVGVFGRGSSKESVALPYCRCMYVALLVGRFNAKPSSVLFQASSFAPG